MKPSRAARLWSVLGAACLAVTAGVAFRRGARTAGPAEELRDAVASPAPVAARAVLPMPRPAVQSPAERRAAAERALMASRLKRLSRALDAKAASLRREAARAVSAQ